MSSSVAKPISLWSSQCMASEFISLPFVLGYTKYPPCRRMCQIIVVSLVGREYSLLNSSVTFDSSLMKRGD
jgi:hypothetical protein